MGWPVSASVGPSGDAAARCSAATSAPDARSSAAVTTTLGATAPTLGAQCPEEHRR